MRARRRDRAARQDRYRRDGQGRTTLSAICAAVASCYGIELVEDRGTREPANEMCREAVRQCQEEGLLVQSRGSHGRSNVMRLVPPMVWTDAEIDRGMDILHDALRTAVRGERAKAA